MWSKDQVRQETKGQHAMLISVYIDKHIIPDIKHRSLINDTNLKCSNYI